MRNLIKNCKPVVVLNYLSETDYVDSVTNFKTGEKVITYSDEQHFIANIGGVSGNATISMNGTNIPYTRIMVISHSLKEQLGITENSVFFVDKEPEYDSGNKPLYDYKIKCISDTLNECKLYIEKVR